MDRQSQQTLTLDLGNTSLKGIVWAGERVLSQFRVTDIQQVPGPELESIARVLCVAVPGRSGGHGICGLPPGEWVGRELSVPGHVSYDKPCEMGLDRRVACHAALALFGEALVLDCGTAVTLTHVDEQERISGIAISTGFACLQEGLFARAPALRALYDPGVRVPESCPDGTAENLSLGLHLGWEGLLRALVGEARVRIGETANLVICGTDAQRAHAALPSALLEPFLLHKGLLLLADGP